MTIWTFEQIEVVHQIDGKRRIAGRLCVNGTPTGTFVYSRQRARDVLARHMVGSTPNEAMVRNTLQAIDQARFLPEHMHDFPDIVLCQCGKHATVLNADGIPLQGWPSFSLQVLFARCREASGFDIPERYRDTMRYRAKELALPLESPLDLLAAALPYTAWASTNWCELA